MNRLDGIELDVQYGTGSKLAVKRMLIKRHLKPGKVLDLGCGNGLVSYDFGDVTGVEISMLRANQAEELIKVKRADVLNTGCKTGSFDVVVACDLIEHMQRPYDLLLEANRVLREGGQLFVETPNALNFERYLKLVFNEQAREESPNHLFLFDRISLTEMLTRTDFKIDKIYYIGFTFPGWRWLMKKLARPGLHYFGNELDKANKVGMIGKIGLVTGSLVKPFAYSLLIVAHKEVGYGDAVRQDPAMIYTRDVE